MLVIPEEMMVCFLRKFVFVALGNAQEAEKKRNEINGEALAVSLAYTNSVFLFLVVLMAFWLFRYCDYMCMTWYLCVFSNDSCL
jgi:hypothetical protein